MLKRGWFGGGIWKPKNLHSLEHLRYLYTVLSKNQNVHDGNRSLLVETLRSIAEILIWGDQNDSSVFDFFLEKNMLSYFLCIMRQKCGSYVCVQLLQTLNILFENIRNETSLYYLLSNNHVNSIIVHKFDFSDEEVMAYYISFLKTLSFKLNSHTIHFFYNEHTNDFPLYTEGIKFFNHPESMVRIAVRTLTLNVFRVEDQSMLQFIRDRTAAPYFSNLVWFIGNHILELDSCVRADVDHCNRDRLADLVGEHLDHLHYLNDILKLNILELNAVLADHLLNRLLVPLLVYSLNPLEYQDERPRVSRVVALFLLSQVFLIFSHPPLMQVLARIVLCGDNKIFGNSIVEGPMKLCPSFIAPMEPLEKSLQNSSRPGSSYGDESETATEAYELEEHSLNNAESQFPGRSLETSKFSISIEDVIGDPDLDDSSLFNCNPERSFIFNSTASVCDSSEDFVNSSAEHSNLHGDLHHEDDCGLMPETDAHGDSSLTDVEKGFKTQGGTIVVVNPSSAGISELEATHVNLTDEEKDHLKSAERSSTSSPCPEEVSLSTRPFLQCILESLSCLENDYSALFSLCLLYAIGHNTGINQDLIASSLGHRENGRNLYYNSFLIEYLHKIISHSTQYNSKIRIVTLEMTLGVLRHLIGLSNSPSPNSLCTIVTTPTKATNVVASSNPVNPISNRKTVKSLGVIESTSAYLRDQHLASLEGSKEEATLLLRNFYRGEDMFLDMFEDEWRELTRRTLNVEFLLQDVSILLPPANTPLTGIQFNKRLPCGEVEKTRRSMRVFFLIRSFCLEVRNETDSHLPLTNPAACVQVEDVLDLNNSDLIACVVITRDGQRTRRFLVIDVIQLILVEPDQRRLGWGVAKFVGFLQDLEVGGDKDDSRVLHITIHKPTLANQVSHPSNPLLNAKFIFDDHIRCMAAKQRLSKGRLKSRQRKLHHIARLLEMPHHLQPCPSPPAHALSTMRQEAHRRVSQRSGGDHRSRSASHRGRFSHSSRGPGVAFKRDVRDEANTGTSDLTKSLGLPVRNQDIRKVSPKASRSVSRPRPKNEEIPLEDFSANSKQESSKKNKSPNPIEEDSKDRSKNISDKKPPLSGNIAISLPNPISIYSIPSQLSASHSRDNPTGPSLGESLGVTSLQHGIIEAVDIQFDKIKFPRKKKNRHKVFSEDVIKKEAIPDLTTTSDSSIDSNNQQMQNESVNTNECKTPIAVEVSRENETSFSSGKCPKKSSSYDFFDQAMTKSRSDMSDLNKSRRESLREDVVDELESSSDYEHPASKPSLKLNASLARSDIASCASSGSSSDGLGFSPIKKIKPKGKIETI